METVEAVGGTAVGCLVPSRLISFKLRGGHLNPPRLGSQLFLCTSQPATPQSNGRSICASLSACVLAHRLVRFCCPFCKHEQRHLSYPKTKILKESNSNFFQQYECKNWGTLAPADSSPPVFACVFIDCLGAVYGARQHGCIFASVSPLI